MNKNIGQKKMVQVLGRCSETRSSTSDALVISTYDDVLADKAAAFTGAMAATKGAKTRLFVARNDRDTAIRGFERLYLSVKAIIAVHVVGEELPGALSVQSTDTETGLAIEAALDILNGHHGESWADALVTGDFGTRARDVTNKITSAADAAKQLYAAQVAAREAYDALYPGYLGFKAVVRNQLGPSSPDYRRINVRGKTAVAEPAPGPTPEPVPAPSPELATVPANGGSHAALLTTSAHT